MSKPHTFFFVYIHTPVVKKEFAENPIKSRHQLKLIIFDYEIKGSGDVIEIETEGVSLLDYTKVDYLYELGYIKAKEKFLDFK